jgi:hypothetical protein
MTCVDASAVDALPSSGVLSSMPAGDQMAFEAFTARDQGERHPVESGGAATRATKAGAPPSSGTLMSSHDKTRSIPPIVQKTPEPSTAMPKKGWEKDEGGPSIGDAAKVVTVPPATGRTRPRSRRSSSYPTARRRRPLRTEIRRASTSRHRVKRRRWATARPCRLRGECRRRQIPLLPRPGRRTRRQRRPAP